MLLDRRALLEMTLGGCAASLLPTQAEARTTSPLPYKAVAFDAFPIFDPRPIVGVAETLFPGKGAELNNVWRTRQFEYQWLHALGRHYVDFWQTTEDGLRFAAKTLNLELTSEKRDQLMETYLHLKAWPDVLPTLQTLKQAGIRLAFLSNMTKKMLEANIHSAGLDNFFEYVLTTDQIRTYKPDPRAYEMATKAFHLGKEEIAFVAFAGWDAAGAKWFGYPTFWVNRLHVPAEELGITADATGPDLNALVDFVKARR